MAFMARQGVKTAENKTDGEEKIKLRLSSFAAVSWRYGKFWRDATSDDATAGVAMRGLSCSPDILRENWF